MITQLLPSYPTPDNDKLITAIKNLIKVSFGTNSSQNYIKIIFEYLNNPSPKAFAKIIFIDFENDKLQALALLSYNKTFNFMFLDCLAVAPENKGQGLGQKLYHHLQDYTKNLQAKALFFECIVDIPSIVKDEKELFENTARLRFYKKFGAKPIIGSKWEEPDEDDIGYPSFLMLDNLNNQELPSALYVSNIVRCLLENKFSYCCSKENIEMVVNSFKEPITLRP